jgi:prevent-host-death family protein
VTSVAHVDANDRLDELLDRVEHGEEVTITRLGKPVARLVPVSREIDREFAKIAAAGLREMSADLRLDGLKIKDLIDEGRR